MLQIINWNNLSNEAKKEALTRPFASLEKISIEQVRQILQKIKSEGDQAVIAFTEKFDNVKLNDFKVSETEFIDARSKVSEDAKSAIEFAKRQLQKNHQAQLPLSQTVQLYDGVTCERQVRAIDKVGLYIPGGSAPLISTVLMLGVPAEIANPSVKILCTPPNLNGEVDPHILFAAELCGIDQIYKVGGVQAIGAMAYGTQTIPKVDKIFGPGNTWVTQAKRLVSQDSAGASIDLPAGPSELMIIADRMADADFVAADLLSQAEHGPDSQVMLVTTSNEFANKVIEVLPQQLNNLPRATIANQALKQSRIIIVESIEQAISISNEYAPEHLILQVKKSEQFVSQIKNAGTVFLGTWAPESVGDYVTGSNHVLPTSGYAKSYSGLSVTDFMKYISFQVVTREGLQKIGPVAEKLADLEGLEAHKRAVSKRLISEVCDEQCN